MLIIEHSSVVLTFDLEEAERPHVIKVPAVIRKL